jgi:hypothetical protein
MSQGWIARRLHKLGLAGCWTSVVGDKVEMLATLRGDTEGLLHQPIDLVPVPVWLAVVLVLVATAARVRRLASTAPSTGLLLLLLLSSKATPTLALHFSVGQEATGHSTRTPRFAVRPSSHPSFSFIPNVH